LFGRTGDGSLALACPMLLASRWWRAIREGRQCARGVDEFLMGSSELPR